MVEAFKKYLDSACNCSLNSKFLLTVSGGIDSVAMAHLFHSAGLNFGIAHCNFQLRGHESDSDEKFVEALAVEMNVPCYVKRFNTKDKARELGISIQMAARDLRYAWFEECAIINGCDYIAVAHNRNDVVETVLLNLARGTGLRGMMGIKAVNKRVVRPLLFASRQMITDYARECNLKWREDSSNTETKYHRNKIRHSIIPSFESINPAFMQNAINAFKRIEQAGSLVDKVLREVKENVWTEKDGAIFISISRLKQYPESGFILYELLRDYGISQLSDEMLMNTFVSSTGKQFHTQTHTITHDRDALMITERFPAATDDIVILPETTVITRPIHLKLSWHHHEPEFSIPSAKNIAVIDAGKLHFPLILRGWQEGDKFRPLGLNGSKKVSDFLINIKLPLPEKKKLKILESNGSIVWLVNHRLDDRFKVTAKTKRILLIECVCV